MFLIFAILIESLEKENIMTTKTIKTVNYSPALEAKLRELAAAQPSGLIDNVIVNQIAETKEYGDKNAHSLRQKCNQMGIYKKAGKVSSKTGEAVVRKEQLVEIIANEFGLQASDIDSLVQGQKLQLLKITDAIEARKAA